MKILGTDKQTSIREITFLHAERKSEIYETTKPILLKCWNEKVSPLTESLTEFETESDWVCEWVSDLLSEWVSDSLSEWVSDLLSERFIEWVSEWWTNKFTEELHS